MVIALVGVVCLLVGLVAGLLVKRSCVFDAGVLAGQLQSERSHGWPVSDPVVKARRRSWLVDRKRPPDRLVTRSFRPTRERPEVPRQR